jgi:transcriptional regulator
MQTIDKVAMKTIRISDETHKRLTLRGLYGDNMDDIVKRVLDSLDKLEVQFKKESSKK